MKIYNEIVMDMNPESASYNEVLSEDSFDHSGEIMNMGASIPLKPSQGQWGMLGQSKNRRNTVEDQANQLDVFGNEEGALAGQAPGATGAGITNFIAKDKTGLEQLSNPKVSSGLYSPVSSTGAGYAQGLPSAFNNSLADSPLKDLASNTNPITAGGSGLGGAYNDTTNKKNTLPGLGGAAQTALTGGVSDYQGVLETGAAALRDSRAAQSQGLQGLYDFYGTGLEGSTPGVTAPTEVGGGTSKLVQEQNALADSLSSPTTAITTNANKYADSMTGPGGLFGDGSQAGFSIGQDGGALNYDGSAFDYNAATGDISNLNASDYGGDIFSILDSIRKSDEGFDKSESATRDSFASDVRDSERDMRLAKEGKLDFSNATQRDIQKIKDDRFKTQLQTEKLRGDSGLAYSGPTERAVSRNQGDLRETLNDLVTKNRIGSRGKEQDIKDLKIAREETQGKFNEDIGFNLSDRKNLMESEFANLLEGAQGTASQNFGDAEDSLGVNAANLLAGGFNQNAGNPDAQSVSQIAAGLGITDLFGDAGLSTEGTGPAPDNYSYANAPTAGVGGTVGAQFFDAYNNSQANLDTLGNQYRAGLTAQTGLAGDTTDSDNALELLKDPAAIKNFMANQSTASRQNLNQALESLSSDIGSSGTLYGKDGSLAPMDAIDNPQATTNYGGETGILQNLGNETNDNILNALSLNIGGLGESALSGESDSVTTTLDAMPTLSPSAQGTLRGDEANLGQNFQSLWENVLSPQARESFLSKNYELPAGDLRVATEAKVFPGITGVTDAAINSSAPESKYDGPNEHGTDRDVYAGILNQTTKSGGVPTDNLIQRDSNDRGGVWQDYSPRIGAGHGKEAQSKSIELNKQSLLDSMLTPSTTESAQDTIRTILGQDTYSPGVDTPSSEGGTMDYTGASNPLAGLGGELSKGLLGGGWKGSEAFNSYAQTVNPENRLGQGANPGSDPMLALRNYLESQGFLSSISSPNQP